MLSSITTTSGHKTASTGSIWTIRLDSWTIGPFYHDCVMMIFVHSTHEYHEHILVSLPKNICLIIFCKETFHWTIRPLNVSQRTNYTVLRLASVIWTWLSCQVVSVWPQVLDNTVRNKNYQYFFNYGYWGRSVILKYERCTTWHKLWYR